MEEGLKSLLKGLKGMPKAARDCDACSEMELRLKQLLACMPLVTDLSSPAMRDRHWEALFTGLCLGDLTVLMTCSLCTTCPHCVQHAFTVCNIPPLC